MNSYFSEFSKNYNTWFQSKSRADLEATWRSLELMIHDRVEREGFSYFWVVRLFQQKAMKRLHLEVRKADIEYRRSPHRRRMRIRRREPSQVTFGEDVFPVSWNQATILRLLRDADGDWLSGEADLKPAISGGRPDREIATLPEQLKSLVESGGPKGYRIARKALAASRQK